jgi:hypothetical protein
METQPGRQVVQLPHCTSQTLIKPCAFEMYVRVRVLAEQEENGLFGRHMTDQCCTLKSLSRSTTRVFNRVTVSLCKPTLTARMRIGSVARIGMECHSDYANSQSTLTHDIYQTMYTHSSTSS